MPVKYQPSIGATSCSLEWANIVAIPLQGDSDIRLAYIAHVHYSTNNREAFEYKVDILSFTARIGLSIDN